jgi:hypothetical protein
VAAQFIYSWRPRKPRDQETKCKGGNGRMTKHVVFVHGIGWGGGRRLFRLGMERKLGVRAVHWYGKQLELESHVASMSCGRVGP